MTVRSLRGICIVVGFFFPLLCNTPVYRLLSKPLLTDIWIISSFWLLRMELAWTCWYMCFGGHEYSFLLGVYIQEWLCWVKRLCKYLALISITKQFSLPPAGYESFSCQQWVLSVLLILYSSWFVKYPSQRYRCLLMDCNTPDHGKGSIDQPLKSELEYSVLTLRATGTQKWERFTATGKRKNLREVEMCGALTCR